MIQGRSSWRFRPLLLLTAWAAAWAADPALAVKPPFLIAKPAPVAIAKPDWTIPLRAGVPDLVRLREAFRAGGSIVFETGGRPVTLPLDEQLLMSQQAKPIVLDGQGLVTIDGQGRTRAIAKEWKTDLTVQRLRFIHCRAEKEGGAIWNTNFDGRLAVIDCAFEDCKTTAAGPDIGGGAICVRGQRPMLISNSSFTDCAGSNGGATNTIQSEVHLIDCSFENCRAFGVGGGADAGPTGQGGIGGAVYSDAVTLKEPGWEYFLAGCLFRGNVAGDHGGAIFAYCDPNRNAGGIFWNCHFEANTVGDTGKLRFAGAIYTQHHRQLWVGNCSFWDNQAGRLAGAVFMAANGEQTYLGCEFAGNMPEFDGTGAGLVFQRLTPSVSMRGLGRLPGPLDQQAPGAVPPVKEKERKEKPRPPPPVVVAKASDASRARFDERLRLRVAAAAAAGKGPIFVLSSMRSEATLRSVGEAGCEVDVGGSSLSLAWRSFADADRVGMAQYQARSGQTEDLVVAAFWLRVAGRTAEAQIVEARAGEAAAEVRAAFAAP